MIFLAVISGRGGCWVGDPVKAAFQGMSGNTKYALFSHIFSFSVTFCLSLPS